MIKLISSDMDGTLLDSYRQITPINVEAIKRAQENGINFIINTGREYPNARGLVETAGLKCDLICSNGACAFDKDGNLLFEHILDKETVRTIFDAFNKYGMEPALFTTEGRISLLPLEEREIYTRDVFIPAIQVRPRLTAIAVPRDRAAPRKFYRISRHISRLQEYSCPL